MNIPAQLLPANRGESAPRTKNADGPLDRRGRRTAFVASILAALLMLPAPATAQEFPSAVKGQSTAQLAKLVQQASAANWIVTDITVTAGRNGLTFDAQFEQNKQGVAWMIQFNVSRAVMQKAGEEYEAEGYVKDFERSARYGQKRYYTAVWKKPTKDPVALELPDTRPISGTGFSGTQPVDDIVTKFLATHNAAGATVAIAKDAARIGFQVETTVVEAEGLCPKCQK